MKDFVMISCHNSGTHSIQCLMEIINTKEEEDVIKFAIQSDILKLSYVQILIKINRILTGLM
jgi:hypothetical protein